MRKYSEVRLIWMLLIILIISTGCGKKTGPYGWSEWAARTETSAVQQPQSDLVKPGETRQSVMQTEIYQTEESQTELSQMEESQTAESETLKIPSIETETREIEITETEATETETTETETEAPTDPLVIVLDPGHDDICARNHPDLGVNEQDLNLKIALACRDELETYKGVVVYMTREDGSCPDNGIGSDDVTGRTAYAESVGADLFVSLHNNATGLGYPSAANGTEVYVTVYTPFADQSRKLGESIMHELTTRLDLTDRGVLTRIKEEKGYYDDGHIQDWYYLISTSVERGFPGIIIEHAYMDNPHDLDMLKDDAQLAAMGVADAIGIARFYQLEKR